LNRVDGVWSQRSSKVLLSFSHRLQRIDLLNKKISKGSFSSDNYLKSADLSNLDTTSYAIYNKTTGVRHYLPPQAGGRPHRQSLSKKQQTPPGSLAHRSLRRIILSTPAGPCVPAPSPLSFSLARSTYTAESQASGTLMMTMRRGVGCFLKPRSHKRHGYTA
jgi:hypothetical protein